MKFSISEGILLIGILTLADAYIMKMKSLQVKPINVWLKMLEIKRENIFDFLSYYYHEEFDNDLKSIVNETINVTASQKMPYISLDANEFPGHHHNICGYIGDLWNELEEALHFKTKYTLKSEILDERADLKNSTDNLLLNPIKLQSGDIDVFDNTMPIAVTWFQLSLRNPNRGSAFFYMSIFTYSLMATYIATLIVLTFSLWFIVKINSTKKNLAKDCNLATVMDISFMASFLTILGTHTNQGIQFKPSTVPLKLLILSSTLFGFILIQSYSAILLSQLAIKQAPSQINLEELPAAMPHRSLCVAKNSVVYTYFMANHSNEVQDKWKPVLNRHPCSGGKADIIPLQDYCNERNMVFESQHNTNYLHNKANFNGSEAMDCNFHTFRRRYYHTYISLLTKKGFRFTNLISTYLLKFHTAGIIKKYQETWLPFSPVQGFKIKSNQPIKFNHVQDLLFLYLLFVLFSLIVLFIEFIIHNYNMRWFT